MFCLRPIQLNFVMKTICLFFSAIVVLGLAMVTPVMAPDSTPNNFLSTVFPTIETISMAFVLPSRNLTTWHVREQLRQYFNFSGQSTPTPPKRDLRDGNTVYRLQVNPVYATGLSIKDAVRDVFCSPASDGINSVFILVDKTIQGEAGAQIANFVTMLANAAGMPTFTWSTNSFELQSSYSPNRFMLAPSIRSQAKALYAFLQTHSFAKFSLIESLQTPGHEVFVEEMHRSAEREHKENPATARGASFVHEQHNSGSRLMRVVKLASNWQTVLRSKLISIRDNDRTRFIIMYVNKEEADEIFTEARTLGMTSSEYTWVCAKPVLGDDELKAQAINFAPGTVVVSYNNSLEAQLQALKAAAQIWSTAVRKLIQKPFASRARLSPAAICDDGGLETNAEWNFVKEEFIELIKETKIQSNVNQTVWHEFDETGTLELSRIVLMNLDGKRNWGRFGEWTPEKGLVLTRPEIFHSLEENVDTDLVVLKVVTLQEPPYITYEPMNPLTNSCPRTAIPCQLSPLVHLQHVSMRKDEVKLGEVGDTMRKVGHNVNDSWVCCVGFCVDLLRRLSDDIGFKFTLSEVSDRKWGSTHNDGQWNGLVKALLTGEADLVMTSLKINRDRSEVIAFSVPFLETGITILVSVREVATSATAFLEPFSIETWFAIMVGLINICALATFFFEYSSIVLRGKDDRIMNPCQFSPFSSLWLSWSMLFKAVFKVQIPKSIAAKMMTCIWGMFCVIFVSSYMANLAVFMITKEDFNDFTGLEDARIQNPYTKNPPWKFATINHGATETFLKQNYAKMYDYMRDYNKVLVEDAVDAVKNGSLDAFIYDAKVLEYKVGRDKLCKLRIVGKWYATTGYAIGFPKTSKWTSVFDKKLIDYQHNGYIQQLTDFWLTGDCQRYKKAEMQKSYQLGVMNFMSAFILLFFGISVCMVLLLFEHLWSKSVRRTCFSRRGAYLWDKVLQMLNIRFITPPFRSPLPSEELATPPVIVKICTNCGGRGHLSEQCSSPAMRMRLYRNLSKEPSNHQYFDSLDHFILNHQMDCPKIIVEDNDDVDCQLQSEVLNTHELN